MSAARKPAGRPHRFIVVRGGLEDGDGGGGDWEDFCHRIGWQTPAPEPDDDFERRLAEGLRANRSAPDNVVDVEAALSASGVRARLVSMDLEARPSPEAPARLDVESPAAASFAPAPEVAVDGPRRRWQRVAIAAATFAVAAAAALAVIRLASSPASSKEATIAAPWDEMWSVTAPPSPEHAVDQDRFDAPLPMETGPVRATPPPQPTAKPGPTPKPLRVEPPVPPDARPEPPGLMVARRSADEGFRMPERGARPGVAAMSVMRRLDTTAPEEPSMPWAAAGRTFAARRPAIVPALASVDAPLPAKSDAGGDVWSQLPAAAEPAGAEVARAASPSWSLAGAKDRWVGASLTSPPPALASASIGVIVQLDLGRALDNL